MHAEAPPIAGAVGDGLEPLFLNMGIMMHPMHMHGHHFQVVEVGKAGLPARAATWWRSLHAE